MMHVWSRQASKLVPAHAEAHFPPSQKPRVKNSISQSAKSSGESMPPRAPILLISVHRIRTLTTTSAPVRLALKHSYLEKRPWNPHQCPSQRDITERVPHRASESHKARAPLSPPLITFFALSFPGENYCPQGSQIQSVSHSVYTGGQMTSTFIIWHYYLVSRSNVSLPLTCFTASSSRSSRNCLFMSLFCDPKMQRGLISSVWHEPFVKTFWHIIYGISLYWHQPSL